VQKIEFGLSVESLVCDFLETQALRCIHRNYRCRVGEIDLIFIEESSATLVFVEVRYRHDVHHGNATETVDKKKQRKLVRAVLHFLQKHSDSNQHARIDVVGVSESDSCTSTDLQYEGVTEHSYAGMRLVWTKSAIEDA